MNPNAVINNCCVTEHHIRMCIVYKGMPIRANPNPNPNRGNCTQQAQMATCAREQCWPECKTTEAITPCNGSELAIIGQEDENRWEQVHWLIATTEKNNETTWFHVNGLQMVLSTVWATLHRCERGSHRASSQVRTCDPEVFEQSKPIMCTQLTYTNFYYKNKVCVA